MKLIRHTVLFAALTSLLWLAAFPAHAVTTYSVNACMPKPTPGDPASQNTWGALLNIGADIIDGITQGAGSISAAGSSNVVLTFSCGTLDQTDKAHFIFTGALTGNVNVLWPASRQRQFSVTNNTTGSFTLSFGANNGASAPAGAVATLPQGGTGIFYSDGTNVYTRMTTAGVVVTTNAVVGNATASTAAAQNLAIPNCSGGLTYTTNVGFGCGSGGGGGGGTGLAFGGVQTTSFAAAANTIYCVDTSGGAVTMTLPASPAAGNQIVFLDCGSAFATYPLTVANNAQLLMGLNENMTVSTTNAATTMIYASVGAGWRMY